MTPWTEIKLSLKGEKTVGMEPENNNNDDYDDDDDGVDAVEGYKKENVIVAHDWFSYLIRCTNNDLLKTI